MMSVMSVMKISLLFPESGVNIGGKNFLWWVAQELKVDVLENDCSEDCDLIISMSVTQLDKLRKFHSQYPKIKIITYHWDLYPFAERNEEYLEFMRKSVEVWSGSQNATDVLKMETGISSIPVYGCIVPEEWGSSKDEGYAVMASRDEWYKRFNWFEVACKELNIPFKSYHPGLNTRADYLNGIANSSVVVSTSLYEGFGLTPIEGAYMGKPLVLADTDVFRELWDGRACFFSPHRYNDFKKVLKQVYESRDVANNKTYVEANYLPEHMAQRMYDRFEAIVGM